jgi:thymidylate kinase
MKKKICIIGTHGCGKTTYSYILATKYKKMGHNVKIVQEVARTCPYPINLGMTREACLWIYYEHAKKELDALCTHDVVISDRSVIDSFLYAKATDCFEKLEVHYNCAMERMKNYDQIIYVKPGKKEATADGFRCLDKDFQISVKEQFDIWIETCQIPYVTMTTDDIFKEGNY